VTPAQARAYSLKAAEFLEAASTSLLAGHYIAATSLAIHAGINSADAVCGIRIGVRHAGDDHHQVFSLLDQAGPDGGEVKRHLQRLLPLKTRAEYESDAIDRATAGKALERARRCVTVAARLTTPT
jgi:hypothetical protein